MVKDSTLRSVSVISNDLGSCTNQVDAIVTESLVAIVLLVLYRNCSFCLALVLRYRPYTHVESARKIVFEIDGAVEVTRLHKFVAL